MLLRDRDPRIMSSFPRARWDWVESSSRSRLRLSMILSENRYPLFRIMLRFEHAHALAAGRASVRPERRRPRDAARLQFGEIADELPGAVFPRTLQREAAACLARHFKRAHAGVAQIGIERSDRVIGNHVERTHD